ncbi:hypothetical protein O3G_MSEX009216 [Manduca sexta]|uniref:Uncharacterized protein n=3 Tax=Manduca sexta TaxID=7130 RepID=A0A921ZCS1_MANSE|nr:hypothetical protein O3G_MSEX009216 [Manduca sexta]KAG6455460.1 hypothetical protein O3G_MSEX009216 [Manduca sexta]
MCVVVLCFVLLAVTEGRVIKTKEFPLPAEGIVMEFLVKNKSDMAHPISTLKMDIDQLTKKIIVTQSEDKMPVVRHLTPKPDVPSFENRFGVRVGTCPSGYVRRGTFCFPDDDY